MAAVDSNTKAATEGNMPPTLLGVVPPKCPGQTRQSTGIYAKISAVTFKVGARSCQPSSGS